MSETKKYIHLNVDMYSKTTICMHVHRVYILYRVYTFMATTGRDN